MQSPINDEAFERIACGNMMRHANFSPALDRQGQPIASVYQTAILYVLGFAFFAVTLGGPAPDEAAKVDAIVVITGGKGRIERGIEVLEAGRARRLLVAGADPAVTKRDLVRRLGGHKRLVDCCVDLGSESVDTRSNAEETKRWLDKHHPETGLIEGEIVERR